MSNRVRNLKLVGTTVGIDSFIPDYTQHETYKVGDIVVIEQGIWRCTTDIADAPATLNELNWQKVGGSDAIVLTINRVANTWTSTETFAKTREGIGKQVILVRDTGLGGICVPELTTDGTTNIILDYSGFTTVGTSPNIYTTRTHFKITAKNDGTLTKSMSYDATGDNEGYATNIRTLTDAQVDTLWSDETVPANQFFLDDDNVLEYTKKVKEKMAFIEDSVPATQLELLDWFYPVGSIYMSMDSTFDPNASWGGTWVKIEAGRFIEATETDSQVATNVAAGLPNIIGSWSFARGAFDSAYSASGAFRYTARGSTKPASETGQGDGTLDFNASNSNSIYGNSTTVQPKSIRAYIWRRTA